jgi:hypothetical protein
MATQTTNFPIRPSKVSDPSNIAWTVWQNLLWFVSIVYDQFAGKFDRGSATITAGNTTIAVGHQLGVATYSVVVTPTTDPGGRFWVSGKTSSQFTINLSVAPGGAVGFDWFAKAA